MPRQPSTSPLPQDLGASPSPTRPHRAVRGLDENGSHLPVTLQRPRRKTAAPLPAEGQGRMGTSDSRLSAQGPGPGPCGPFLSPGDCAHQCDRKYSGRVLQTQVRIPAVPLPPGETSDRGVTSRGCSHICTRRRSGRNRDRLPPFQSTLQQATGSHRL